MLSQGKTMEIAELYDLTHSYATTAQLAGVDPKTVKRALARRAAGYPPETRERGSVADPYLDKIDEWIERSSGLLGPGVREDRGVGVGRCRCEVPPPTVRKEAGDRGLPGRSSVLGRLVGGGGTRLTPLDWSLAHRPFLDACLPSYVRLYTNVLNE